MRRRHPSLRSVRPTPVELGPLDASDVMRLIAALRARSTRFATNAALCRRVGNAHGALQMATERDAALLLLEALTLALPSNDGSLISKLDASRGPPTYVPPEPDAVELGGCAVTRTSRFVAEKYPNCSRS
jgi:hypothetical protein